MTIGYLSLDSAGGSGYLGAFLAGLIVGNMEHLGPRDAHGSRAGDAPVRVQPGRGLDLVIFGVLGANIPFAELGDNLLPSPAVLAVLLVIARPLTVLVCTLPDRRAGWTRQERAF